jgi:hypothetical protein
MLDIIELVKEVSNKNGTWWKYRFLFINNGTPLVYATKVKNQGVECTLPANLHNDNAWIKGWLDGANDFHGVNGHGYDPSTSLSDKVITNQDTIRVGVMQEKVCMVRFVRMRGLELVMSVTLCAHNLQKILFIVIL